jgi:hypothetical protein
MGNYRDVNNCGGLRPIRFLQILIWDQFRLVALA